MFLAAECQQNYLTLWQYRSSRPEVYLGKGALKICSEFTGEHPCRSVISIKLLCNFIEITLRHWCSPVNLLLIFRTPFLKNTSGRLLLTIGVYFSGCWKKLTEIKSPTRFKNAVNLLCSTVSSLIECTI